MPIIYSDWTRFEIRANKPSQLQNLQDYVPRRPKHLPHHTICEGEIKEYNFANCVDNSPKYFGTTYKVKLAKDIDGNPIDNVDLIASIPNENIPLVRFDASKITLTGNNFVRSIYYKIIVVQPNGGCYHSTWTVLTIKTRKNKHD